jgi:hypothetical protein
LIEDKAEQPLELPVKKEKRQHKKLSINEIEALLEDYTDTEEEYDNVSYHMG